MVRHSQCGRVMIDTVSQRLCEMDAAKRQHVLRCFIVHHLVRILHHYHINNQSTAKPKKTKKTSMHTETEINRRTLGRFPPSMSISRAQTIHPLIDDHSRREISIVPFPYSPSRTFPFRVGCQRRIGLAAHFHRRRCKRRHQRCTGM